MVEMVITPKYGTAVRNEVSHDRELSFFLTRYFKWVILLTVIDFSKTILADMKPTTIIKKRVDGERCYQT